LEGGGQGLFEDTYPCISLGRLRKIMWNFSQDSKLLGWESMSGPPE